MNQEDLTRSAIQHLEMENYISGGTVIKSEKKIPDTKPASPSGEKQAKLDEIAAEIAQCTQCPLSETRTKTVAGEGNPDADIVFIGEGPGANEDKQGKPFVGRAGKLLDNIIKAMGLSREDVFIGNIIKCRPPGNRDPKPDEIKSCFGYLQKQLEIIEPKVIIALGSPAAKSLLDTTEGIGKLRGKFHEYVPDIGKKPIKLMPTYHPAYLLRNYTKDARSKVWSDVQKVLEELGLPVPEK